MRSLIQAGETSINTAALESNMAALSTTGNKHIHYLSALPSGFNPGESPTRATSPTHIYSLQHGHQKQTTGNNVHVHRERNI